MIPEFTAVAGGRTESGFEAVYGVDKRGRIWRLVIVAGGEAQRWQPLRSDGFDWANYPADPDRYTGLVDFHGEAIKEGDKILCKNTGEEGVVLDGPHGDYVFVSEKRTAVLWTLREEGALEVINANEAIQ